MDWILWLRILFVYIYIHAHRQHRAHTKLFIQIPYVVRLCLIFFCSNFHILSSPDIEPNSLEWLLLLRLVWLLLLLQLLLLLLSIEEDVRLLCEDFSKTSWSSLQYNTPPSRNANSSPEIQKHIKIYISVLVKVKYNGDIFPWSSKAN